MHPTPLFLLMWIQLIFFLLYRAPRLWTPVCIVRTTQQGFFTSSLYTFYTLKFSLYLVDFFKFHLSIYYQTCLNFFRLNFNFHLKIFNNFLATLLPTPTLQIVPLKFPVSSWEILSRNYCLLHCTLNEPIRGPLWALSDRICWGPHCRGTLHALPTLLLRDTTINT